MKEKIIIFIIGLLLGAIISTGSIYFYTVANNSNSDNGQGMQMNGGTPPSKPNEHSQDNSNSDNTQNSNESNNN